MPKYDAMKGGRGSAILLAIAGLAAIGVPAHAANYRQAMLTPIDGASSDQFGNAVALEGNTAVIGARYDDLPAGSDAGSASVWVRAGSTWSRQAVLTAADAAASDHFGSAVALSGDTAVVGSRDDDHLGADAGSAYVFVRSGTSWVQQAKLTAPDAAAGDVFGGSVAIVGDTILIGAIGDDVGANVNAGSTYVFVRSGATWSQQAKLTAADIGTAEFFGSAVALGSPATTALIGSRNDHHAGGSQAGSAYVFTVSGTVWSQQAKLIAADSATQDFFGSSVAISGTSAVVGSPGDDTPGGTDAGSAYVFTRAGTVWTQNTKLTASDGDGIDQFGAAVAIEGDLILVGAENDEQNGPNAGSAYLFQRTGTGWVQDLKLMERPFALFGSSVALSADTRLIGAPIGGTGGAHVFVDDDQGAAITFDQSDGDVLVYVSVAQAGATGTVSAAGAGVDFLDVTFRNDITGARTTVHAALNCNPDRTDCTWQVDPRLLPGRFTLSATAQDIAGNVTTASGPNVLLIGTGQRSV